MLLLFAGITSLGYDHMELLGDTLDLIAREKAGIMRKGVPCFTVQQPPEAMAALEVGVQLQQPTSTQIVTCSIATTDSRFFSSTLSCHQCLEA